MHGAVSSTGDVGTQVVQLAEESGIEKAARALVKKDHSLVRFYITTGALYKP